MARSRKMKTKRGGRKKRTQNSQVVSALQALAPDAPDAIGEFRTNPMDFLPRMPIVRFSPPVFGFPDRLMTRLRYHTTGSIQSTSGVINSYVFRWNSTFDPDATSGGHQPMYRDTFAAVYDHYSVIRARAQVRYVNGTTDLFICGVLTDDDTSGPSSVDACCEQSHGYHALLSPVSGSRSSVKFIASWDCRKVLGIDPFTSEQYKTGVGSNPAEESDLILWAADSSGNTGTLTFDVELEYDVLWTELATPTTS